MYPYIDKKYPYREALDLKFPKTKSILEKHPPISSQLVLGYDKGGAVEVGKALAETKEYNVYENDPNFLNPRKKDRLFKDYSENCIVM